MDADEDLSIGLMKALKERKLFAMMNHQAKMIAFPRVNIYLGISDESIIKNFKDFNRLGSFRWPDYQIRFCENNGDIRWEGKIHERLIGSKCILLPKINDQYAIIHVKADSKSHQNSKIFEKCI